MTHRIINTTYNGLQRGDKLLTPTGLVHVVAVSAQYKPEPEAKWADAVVDVVVRDDDSSSLKNLECRAHCAVVTMRPEVPAWMSRVEEALLANIDKLEWSRAGSQRETDKLRTTLGSALVTVPVRGTSFIAAARVCVEGTSYAFDASLSVAEKLCDAAWAADEGEPFAEFLEEYGVGE